ncbi:hypothetical protein MASR2M78_08630 [Treponema sp.]
MLIQRLRLYSVKNIPQRLRSEVKKHRNIDNEVALPMVLVVVFIVTIIFSLQFMLVPAKYLSKIQVLQYQTLFLSMSAVSILFLPFVIFQQKFHSQTLHKASELYFFIALTWSLFVSLMDIGVKQGYEVYIMGLIVYTVIHRTSLRALIITMVWIFLLGTAFFASPHLQGIELANILPFYLYSFIAVLISAFSETTCIEKSLLRAELRDSNDELRNLSILDPLTASYNRRYLSEYLSRHVPFARRLKLEFSILILDFDKFKDINDQYGHAEGDRVLIKSADVIRSSLREYDLLFRYGGEEFLIVLIKTGLEAAISAAERVRMDMEGTDFGLQGRGVTVSIGIATFPQDGEMDALLNTADARLYAAKAAGRNCCIFS